jgi:hypothetical protein
MASPAVAAVCFGGLVAAVFSNIWPQLGGHERVEQAAERSEDRESHHCCQLAGSVACVECLLVCGRCQRGIKHETAGCVGKESELAR